MIVLEAWLKQIASEILNSRLCYADKFRLRVFESRPVRWLLLPLAAGIVFTSYCNSGNDEKKESVHMNGVLFTKAESAFLSQIRKELSPILERVHTAEGMTAKKIEVAKLVEKTRDMVISPSLGDSQRSAVFLVVAEQLMKQGMFQSTNDKNDVEAAIFFYSHFPNEFIDHAFSKYRDFNFDREIGERYRRAIGKIGQLNSENRAYVLAKISALLKEKSSDTGLVQAKIYASVNAIILKAKELIPAFEGAIKVEKNENLKEVYRKAISDIKSAK